MKEMLIFISIIILIVAGFIIIKFENKCEIPQCEIIKSDCWHEVMNEIEDHRLRLGNLSNTLNNTENG